MSTTGSDDALVEKAQGAYAKAYAPYSKFRVGAALRTAAGTVVTGCNVEDATMNLGVCAERAAIICGIIADGPEMKIDTMAVASEQDGACSPCGNCRQLFSEFATDESRMIFHDGSGYTAFRLEEILPHTFRLTLPAGV
jgi:cytidine deaminase